MYGLLKFFLVGFGSVKIYELVFGVTGSILMDILIALSGYIILEFTK